MKELYEHYYIQLEQFLCLDQTRADDQELHDSFKEYKSIITNNLFPVKLYILDNANFELLILTSSSL